MIGYLLVFLLGGIAGWLVTADMSGAKILALHAEISELWDEKRELQREKRELERWELMNAKP